jgi:hypothetical protein
MTVLTGAEFFDQASTHAAYQVRREGGDAPNELIGTGRLRRGLGRRSGAERSRPGFPDASELRRRQRVPLMLLLGAHRPILAQTQAEHSRSRATSGQDDEPSVELEQVRKGLSVLPAICTEVSNVRGQDSTRTELLRQEDERRIRQVHREVSILLHQRFDAR